MRPHYHIIRIFFCYNDWIPWEIQLYEAPRGGHRMYTHRVWHVGPCVRQLTARANYVLLFKYLLFRISGVE